MIYVRVELWPRGDRSRARVLGEGKIWNKVTGTATRGEYGHEFRGKRGRLIARGDGPRDFPRRQLLVWDLLLRALRIARGARNA